MTQMKTLLFYFSGTGNTWWLVSQFKLQMTTMGHSVHLISIEHLQSDQWNWIAEHWETMDWIGFAHPIYGSDAPKIMKHFLLTLGEQISPVLKPPKKAFVFTTMGLASGDGDLIFRRKLKKLNLTLFYANNFLMRSNLGVPLTTLNPCSIPRFEKRQQRTIKKLKHACEKIAANQKFLKNHLNPMAYLWGGLQRLLIPTLENHNHQFLGVNDETCNHCLQCVKNCPTQSISFTDHHFEFNKTCTACYRCYNFCPTQSITVFNKIPNPKHHRQHQVYMRQKFYSPTSS